MKRVKRASMILMLTLLGFALPQTAEGQTTGPAASGSFKFSPDDGMTKSVEFDARTADGVTTGQLTFTDTTGVAEKDAEGAGGTTAMSFYLKTSLDCLLVDKNRAVMCGTISDSNLKSYIGQRVMLMVEDNGDAPRGQDRVFWGIYKPSGEWVPVDAERPDDEGAYLTWTATDAERKDDVGVPSRKSALITCKSFSPWSYILRDGEGSIEVSP